MLSATERTRQRHFTTMKEFTGKRMDHLNQVIRKVQGSIDEAFASDNPIDVNRALQIALVQSNLAVASAILAAQAEATTLAVAGYPSDITDWVDEDSDNERSTTTSDPTDPS